MNNTKFYFQILVSVLLAAILIACKKDEPTTTQPTPPTPPALDTTPPTVAITNPANGATLTAPTTIKADAVDNVGVAYVEFLVDGTTVGKDSTIPYEQFWNVGYWADGNLHTVLAKAADKAGNIGQSQVVTVTVSTAAVTVPELLLPIDGSFLDTTSIQLVWRHSPIITEYEYQVATSSDFSNIELSGRSSDTTASITPRSPLLWHYWRVRGKNALGSLSIWSEPKRFYRWATFGGTVDDYGHSVQQTIDGGYVIVGETFSFGLGGDVYLIKTDPSGNEQWTRTFGGTNPDRGYSVQQTSDNGYVIAGWRGDGVYGDVYLIKTDANGNRQWERTFGAIRGFSVQQTLDGGYVLVGSTFGDSIDVYLIKTDANGSQQWVRTFGGSGWDEGYFVQQTYDGGYFVAAWTYPGYSVSGIKTDANGIQQWMRTFVGLSYSGGYSGARQTTDGGYVITGNRFNNVYLVKTDSSGNQQWAKNFDGSGGQSVCQTTDGGYIIAGTTSTSSSSIDMYLIKTDANGNAQWTKTFGGTAVDYGLSVRQTTDGGYVIAGYTYSFGKGGSDVFLVKVDANGNIGQ